MKKLETKATICNIERLKNSIYDNPRFKLLLLVELGVKSGKTIIKEAKTVSNGIIGYKINSQMLGKTYVFKCHLTQKNNLILDYVVGD